MSMRDKAKLRRYGWAGECTREEAEYIRDWLTRRCHTRIALWMAREYAKGEWSPFRGDK